jgi:hypothetical protein
MSASPIVKAVEAELVNYPGVRMEFSNRGKHDRILFSRGDTTRFLTVPRTPSDWRSTNNAMRDLRKTMRELGATRAAAAPRRYQIGRGKGTKKMVANVAMNDTIVILHIPKASKLLGRFRTKEGKAVAHWGFELRASPDLTAPPLLVVRKVEIPAGRKFQFGAVAGFNVAGAWRLTMGRGQFPALDKRLAVLPSTGLTLYEDNGDELVFKLPVGTIPTGFTKSPPVEAKGDVAEFPPLDHKPVSPPPTGGPGGLEPAAAPAPAAAPVVQLPDQPMILQLPRQSVSVEQAIAVLNKAKQRLGTSLRFTIEENGFLSAVHRIGR